MRKHIKFITGLVVALFMFMASTNPASAESETTMTASEQETPSSPVECRFHLNTEHTVPEQSAFMVHDEIDFEIALSDPDELVANIMFTASLPGKGGVIQEGLSRTASWIIPASGQWAITALLFDDAGDQIIPTGDCDGSVKALEADEQVAHPDEPDVIEPPTEPQPEPAHPDNPDVEEPSVEPVATPNVQAEAAPAVQTAAVSQPVQMTTLPRTGIKDFLPLFGAALLACGALFVLMGKKRAAYVANR